MKSQHLTVLAVAWFISSPERLCAHGRVTQPPPFPLSKAISSMRSFFDQHHFHARAYEQIDATLQLPVAKYLYTLCLGDLLHRTVASIPHSLLSPRITCLYWQRSQITGSSVSTKHNQALQAFKQLASVTLIWWKVG
jgi:hypothetical protein